MDVIEVLVSEHETISRLLRVIRAACRAILDGAPVNTAQFRQFIHVIRTYADAHHHGKEEQLLFAEMQTHLGPTAEQLVRNGMLVEHDLGRLYVRQLEEALSRCDADDDRGHALDVLANAMAYVDLLYRHIVRENEAVYPFARRALPPQVLESLNARTADFEAAAAASNTQKDSLDLLSQWERLYPL